MRLDSETPPSAEQLADLKEWMQRSPEHRQQLKRLTQHWHSANRLTELSFPLPGSQRDGLLANLRYQFKQLFSHGWQVTATMGVAVSLTVAIALSLMPFNRDGVSGNGIYETRIGEQNTITLVDGSVIQLNTDSQIQVNYLGNQRNIVLTAGEAHFDVAKDPQRPFVVSAGEGMVRAVGTAFSVRLDQQAVKVIVTEGKVALASSASQPTETMQPTQTLQLAPTNRQRLSRKRGRA